MNQPVSGIETVCVPARTEHLVIAANGSREIAKFGGDCSHLVPPAVAARLQQHITQEAGTCASVPAFFYSAGSCE